MNKVVAVAVMLAGFFSQASAQSYFTRTGKVSFYSKAPLENIEAHTDQAIAILNSATDSVAFKISVTSFHFTNKTMEDHFNENYMESSTYPNANFEGKITDKGGLDYKKDGTYNVKVTGKLTIHGETKTVTESGTVTVKGDQVTVVCNMKVKLTDYKIKNDKVKKIADVIDVTVNATMPKKK